MRISTKIYGGFALLLLIMLVIVGTFYYQYAEIEKISHDVMDYRIPLRDKAQTLVLGASREAAAARGYLATGNSKFKIDLEKAKREVADALIYINHNAKVKEVIQPINDANNKFTPHLDKLIALYDTQGQAAAATYLITVAAPDNEALLTEVDKYLERQSQQVAEDMKKIDEQEDRLLVVVLGILGAGLVVGIAGAVLITRPILTSIRQGVTYAESLAQGVFNQELKVSAHDEIGQLLQSLAKASASLRSLLRQVADSAESVAFSSEELTASAEQSAQAANQVATTITSVAQGAQNQVQAVNVTTAAVEHMSASIQQMAANANLVTDVTGRTANSAEQGKQSVEAAIQQMNSIEQTVIRSAQVVTTLGARSKEIGQIVDTISGIASQTNLLALNAAIEAARAGEQGRGFAVVAEEVRKLAEQSQEAAKQIATLIAEIQTETSHAVEAMDGGTREVKVGAQVVNTAGQAFKEIAELIQQVSLQVKEISAAIEQLAAGSEQIVASARDIDRVSKDTAAETQTVSAATEEQSASMEEIAASSQTLAKMAEELQNAVQKFTI